MDKKNNQKVYQFVYEYQNKIVPFEIERKEENLSSLLKNIDSLKQENTQGSII